jgi:hypothetical protein
VLLCAVSDEEAGERFPLLSAVGEADCAEDFWSDDVAEAVCGELNSTNASSCKLVLDICTGMTCAGTVCAGDFSAIHGKTKKENAATRILSVI